MQRNLSFKATLSASAPTLHFLTFGRERHAMRLAKYGKFREEKFGGVLFETRSEKVFTLNGTGAAIVREAAGGTDEREIVRRLRDRYDAPAGAIESEVGALIGDLRGRG